MHGQHTGSPQHAMSLYITGQVLILFSCRPHAHFLSLQATRVPFSSHLPHTLRLLLYSHCTAREAFHLHTSTCPRASVPASLPATSSAQAGPLQRSPALLRACQCAPQVLAKPLSRSEGRSHALATGCLYGSLQACTLTHYSAFMHVVGTTSDRQTKWVACISGSAASMHKHIANALHPADAQAWRPLQLSSGGRSGGM